jgi:hypothetical protein
VLQCYVLKCGRSVTAFLAPLRSQRPGQGSRSPHPKADPAQLLPDDGTALPKHLAAIVYIQKYTTQYICWSFSTNAYSILHDIRNKIKINLLSLETLISILCAFLRKQSTTQKHGGLWCLSVCMNVLYQTFTDSALWSFTDLNNESENSIVRVSKTNSVFTESEGLLPTN